jgi:hypothetical protein
MEPRDELKALARKCRTLAAGISDEETRNSLELLARDYEARAATTDVEPHRPDMPTQQ